MKKLSLERQRILRGHPIPQTASAESFTSEQRPALSLASNNATIGQPPSAQSDVPSIRSTVSSKSFTREHWVQPGENPPVGIILCSSKSEALVRYATEALPTKLLVREYLTALPDEKVLAAELEKTRKQLESRK